MGGMLVLRFECGLWTVPASGVAFFIAFGPASGLAFLIVFSIGLSSFCRRARRPGGLALSDLRRGGGSGGKGTAGDWFPEMRGRLMATMRDLPNGTVPYDGELPTLWPL